MKKLLVEVEMSDILEGEQDNPETCAIACALRRAGYQDPVVEPPMVYCSDGDVAYEAELPDAAVDFANDFDADPHSVEPIKFWARVVN